MNKIILISFLALAVSAETILNTTKNDQTLLYQIISSEQLVVVGFEGQEEVRDYLFCRLPECECEDMVSKGQRSHPKPNSIATVLNIQCENSNTMTFERFDNGFKPYLWGQQKSEPKQAPARITQEVTTTSASNTTYTDTDMTSSITVSTEFTLKWKFNDDGTTIDFCLCLNKKAWIGLGFGKNMKSVDMLTVNIVGSTAQVIDLWSTSDTTPLTDTTQDITLVSYSITDSAFNARITRKLSTGDTTQDTVLTKGSTYTWSYASSSALTMEDHHNDYKTFSITLNTSGAQVASFHQLAGVVIIFILSLLL